MIKPLELKKMQVQVKQIDASREQYELQIAEREQDIIRLQNMIKVADDRLAKLRESIAAGEQELAEAAKATAL